MNRGIIGYPTTTPLGPQSPLQSKLLDINMAGRVPRSTAGLQFDFMLPAGIIALDVYWLDFRWATGPVNVSAGLVNNAGTSAPLVTTYTNDGATAMPTFGGSLRYTIGGRSNSVVGTVDCNGNQRGAGGFSGMAIIYGASAALAITAPPVDRFRFYTDATDRILQGQLILMGTFR